MSDNADTLKRSLIQRATMVLACVLFFIVVIYGPLVAHRIEGRVFKTERISQALQDIGAAEILEFIYQNTPGLGR
jgi:hypothetical protein